jgi:hypothetical protein
MGLTTKTATLTLLLLLGIFSTAVLAGHGESARSYTFSVETPALGLVAHDELYTELRIAGFEKHAARPGTPDVPTRTVLVAIPPGATPRLSFERRGSQQFHQVLPRPAPRMVFDYRDEAADRSGRDRLSAERFRGETRRVYRPQPEAYAGQGTYPRRVAWLGEVGVLRNQRYVQVHLAPVRFDRQRGGLLVEPTLDVTVHFDGEVGLATHAAGPDRFEPVYRSAFENYTQGRTFRLGVEETRVPAEPLTSNGTGSSGPIRRIRIRANEIVRLDHTLVAAEAPEFLDTDPRNWRVTHRGLQVPVQRNHDDDALFENGEWLQFYGQAMDQEPETTINFEHATSLIDNLYDVTDYTDENVYWLTVGTGAQPSMQEREAAPTVAAPEPHFAATARVEVDDLFLPVPGATWFWLPFINEGSGPRTETVPLPGLASGTLDAHVRVQVRGLLNCSDIDPDKRSVVSLENDLDQPMILPAGNPDNIGNQNVGEFDGHELFLHDFAWTHSGGEPAITDPLDVIMDATDLTEICAFNGAGLTNDVLLDYIEIDYRRSFSTTTDTLAFDYPDGNALFEISGFTSAAVEVYEVTGRVGESDLADSVRLTGVELVGGTLRFRIDDTSSGGSSRQFVVTGLDSVAIPAGADFEADRVSTLISDTTQADLLVIAHPDLIGGVCSEGANPCSYDVDCVAGATDRCELVVGSSLDRLLVQRAAQGITSRVARIQDVDDEFDSGLAGPPAIKNFLAWLLGGGWGGDAPAYLLLVGDGSLDYKGGTPSGNYVPTQVVITFDEQQGHYPSDNRLAAVVGDDHLSDIVAGRLTARTSGELDIVLNKIIDLVDDPLAGGWDRTVLTIADRGSDTDPDQGYEFEAMNDLATSYLDDTNYAKMQLRYWSDNCGGELTGCNPGVMKQDIKDRVSGDVGPGAALVQFAGHGNYNLWSNDVFFCANEAVEHERCQSDDTDDLTNVRKLPFLIVHNCLTGGFHSRAEKSFGEEWLKEEDAGAMAVYATAGLGQEFLGTQVTEEVWKAVFGKYKARRLAVPVMNTQVRLCPNAIEACQFYVLLGDPSSEIALRSVEPASNLVATASVGIDPEVDLTWDPSATPGVEYEVYRTHQLGQAYIKVSPDEPVLTTPGFVDQTVDVANDYFYYVLARFQGFDSAWSNFNTDCGPQPGPDCVQAMPLNLVPPVAPTGLVASDPETGGRLDLVWNQNPEPDIQLYTVHYGTTPAFGQTQTVLHSSSAILNGLQNGTPYHIAIEATNSSGTASGLSDPVIAVPSLVLGVRSPDRIDDLRLAKSGADALLSWSPVTEDIYGQATTISEYEVHRGGDAEFVPGPGSLLDPQSDLPGFTAVGVLSGSEPHFYLVRAVDDDGNFGGLGGQLPGIITDLLIGPAASPGAIELSWAAVTTDVDDNPTTISHYLIFADDAPFTRGDIRDGVVLQLGAPVAGTSVELVPAGPARHYSVLAVDTRGNLSPF